jgi:hypothetical protein
MNSDKRIYWILILLTIGSYVWIGYHLSNTHSHSLGTLCLFKSATGIPCPSCGITRSVLLLFQGDIANAAWINPLGILASVLLIVIPMWILSDFFRKRNSLPLVYKRSEELIRSNKIIYLPLIALIAINWIWNISKGI